MHKPNTLSKATHKKFLREWLEQGAVSDFDAIVLDIDGVLLQGEHPLPRATEFIDFLHTREIPFALLTNDGCHSPREKAAFLRSCGADIEPTDIVSCAHGLSELAEDRGLTGERFFLMGSLGDPCFAEEAGLHVTRDIAELDNCRGIIVGEKKYDWYEVITDAFNALVKDPSQLLIVPNPDEYFPAGSNFLKIASGATGRFLQHLCKVYGLQVDPIYLGKPFQPIFQYNHHSLEQRFGRSFRKDRILMIGDSLKADIMGAQRFGYRTALMLTGITSEENLVTAQHQPDFIFNSL